MNKTVKIRKIWVNEGSEKDQVTVQFASQLENVNNNKLIAAAQGGEGYGPSLVTALLSFKAEVAQEMFGTTSQDYSDDVFENWPEATAFEAKVGEPIAIQVVENTTKNPLSPNQTPKINPQTQEILCFDGQPIYRHTEVVLATAVKTVLLKHNSVMQPEAVPAGEDAFGAAQ